MLQLRPAGTDTLFYSPDRDLAIVGIGLLRASAILMDSQREPWFQAFLNQNGVSDQMLADGMQKVAVASSYFKDRPGQALKKAGFYSLPWAVQAAIFMKMGQVLYSAVHTSRRSSFSADADRLPVGSDPIEEQAKRLMEQAKIEILNPDSKSSTT